MGCYAGSRGIDGYARNESIDLRTFSSIGEVSDNNGSGVKQIAYMVNGEEPAIMTERGGLFGTYCIGRDFGEVAFERVDPNITFGPERWGPWGPDPSSIPPDDHCIRWHGWLEAPRTGAQEFWLKGHGEVHLEINGSMILDWSWVRDELRISPIPMEKGVKYPFIMFMRNRGPGSDITLEYRNDQADIVPFPSDLLHYPSNSTSILASGTGEVIEIGIRMTDWVGRVSTIFEREIVLDRLGPIFDTGAIPKWTGERQPIIEVNVSDGPGAGVSTGSLAYRYGKEKMGAWSYPDEILETEGGICRIKVKPRIDRDGSVLIQFQGADLLGNLIESPNVRISHDGTPPKVRLLTRECAVAGGSGLVTIQAEIMDPGGCGVDEGSVSFSLKDGDGEDIAVSKSYVNSSNGKVCLTLDANLREGEYGLLLAASDLMGNAVRNLSEITIRERAIDQPPVPKIRSPGDGTEWSAGNPIRLDATGTFDDGLGAYAEVRLNWFSSLEGHIGSGGILEYEPCLGTHVITLYADDGTEGHNRSVSVNIKVVDPNSPVIRDDDEESSEEDKESFFIPILVFSISMGTIITGLAYFLYTREKGSGETMLPVEPMNAGEEEE
jgi:hypothetical protein